MNTTIYYKGEAISLQEFCNKIGFNYTHIVNYSTENNTTLAEATMHYFPMIYMNLLGDLVAPDDF